MGFYGFLEFPTMHPDPQLVYAMFERFSGKGYAIEMAHAAIAEARKQTGFRVIIASVAVFAALIIFLAEAAGDLRINCRICSMTL